ncbi:MAG: lysophospholipid acyltransferase family protein [Polyangiaceae bacterium]|nr:lysophospholipid acyltransferase family protein [Polyangiaceae bacterium]
MAPTQWNAQPQIVAPDDVVRYLPKRTPPWVAAGLLSLTGLADLNRAYADLSKRSHASGNVFEEALGLLRVKLEVRPEELAQVPVSGPTLVVANHPFGGIDGLALAAAMLRCRSDVRIIANSVLSRISTLAPWFVDVFVFDAAHRVSSNAAQLRGALRHLTEGGLLIVFPAGSVSRFQPLQGTVADGAWNPAIGMLARRSGATVVPCYFPGQNSLLFHAIGVVNEQLSTALLPRELLARRDTRVQLHVGHPMQPRTMRRFGDDATLAAWLRLRTYDLRREGHDRARPKPMQPVAAAAHPSDIALELGRLPNSQRLAEQGPYQVYLARQSDIPKTLEEIARLRELTFRHVGEGTGAARDLDAYDRTYHHLVLYDRDQTCVVGAYRLAFCDEAMKARGLRGLYTSTLFRFRPSMRRELLCAIELGRSFVRPEYQKKPLALALLWRGIGEVLCRNPRYRRLVGPVSISDRYRGSCRRLLVSFLKEAHGDVQLGKLVAPKRALRIELDANERRILKESCRDIRQLSQALSELDSSGLRAPILLERYLELGARVLALSVDPNFGNCIDAFVLVELDVTPRNILRRFMGDEGLARYCATADADALLSPRPGRGCAAEARSAAPAIR